MTHRWLIDPKDLHEFLDDETLVLLDIRGEDDFEEGHIRGATLLEYPRFIANKPPVGGLLPDSDTMNQLARELGITSDSSVVCYDDGMGAAAARFIWTLNAYGFKNTTLLNGGVIAWSEEGLPLTTELTSRSSSSITESTITLTRDGSTVVSAESVMKSLEDQSVMMLDTRTTGEFLGTDIRAAHGGRIPGAVHFEWTDAIDTDNAHKLHPDELLNTMLGDRGLNNSQDVMVYCQTHHRSSLTYVMLKHLGYDNVTALDGAWSNWGNRDDTPKETG